MIKNHDISFIIFGDKEKNLKIKMYSSKENEEKKERKYSNMLEPQISLDHNILWLMHTHTEILTKLQAGCIPYLLMKYVSINQCDLGLERQQNKAKRSVFI